MLLTVHGLQSDQTGDKVVKVHGHVGLCVAQDDQLEQVVGQLETWKTGNSDPRPLTLLFNPLVLSGSVKQTNSTC